MAALLFPECLQGLASQFLKSKVLSLNINGSLGQFVQLFSVQFVTWDCQLSEELVSSRVNHLEVGELLSYGSLDFLPVYFEALILGVLSLEVDDNAAGKFSNGGKAYGFSKSCWTRMALPFSSISTSPSLVSSAFLASSLPWAFMSLFLAAPSAGLAYFSGRGALLALLIFFWSSLTSNLSESLVAWTMSLASAFNSLILLQLRSKLTSNHPYEKISYWGVSWGRRTLTSLSDLILS